jgi:penicillin-binding protein 1A
VKLAYSLGMPYLINYLRREAIRSPLAPNLSIALGSSEVSLLELLGAYDIFANQGRRAEPIFITRIVDGEGNTIFEAKPRIRRAIPATTAYQITSILQDVIRRGTGRRASAIGRPAAGKTGTTNDLNDAWFMGYTPQLLAGVWVGFDEKRSLGPHETGGRVAAPIWLQFMEHALDGMPVADFPVPQGIVLTPINPRTGERAIPGDTGAIIEAFRRGTEPTTMAASVSQPDPAADIAAREFFRSEY